MIAGTLELQMLVNLARLADDMRKVQSTVGGAMKNVESSIAGVKSALNALGVGLSLTALVAFTTKAIGAVAALDDLAETTSLTVETLSSLERVAHVGGRSLAEIQPVASRFAKSVAEAAGGNKELIRTFEALGISQQRLRNERFDDLFVEFARKIATAENRTYAIAYATDLAGKSAATAIPFFRDLAEEGLKQGRVSTEQAAAAEQLQKEWNRLTYEAGALKNEMAMGLIPTFTKLVAEFRAAKEAGGGFWGGLGLFLTTPSADPVAEINRIRQTLEKLKQTREDLMRNDTVGKRLNDWLFGDISDINKQIAVLEKQMAVLTRVASMRGERDNFDASLMQQPFKLGAPPGTPDESELKRYLAALQQLEQELGKLNDQTVFERTLYQTTTGSLRELTEAHKARLLEIARDIDAKKTLAAVDAQALKDVQEQEKIRLQLAERANQLRNHEIDASRLNLRAANDELELARYDLALTGQSESARRTLVEELRAEVEVRNRINDAIERGTRLSPEDIAAIRERAREAAALRSQAVNLREEAQRQQAEWQSLWSAVENTGRSVFNILADSGKNMAERIGAAIKSSIIDLLYQLTVRKWIINVGVAMGVPGAANAAGAAGAGSFFGGGGGLISPFNLPGMNVFGAGQFLADIPNFFGSIGSITEAGSTFGLFDAISGFAAAHPVGSALAALSAIGLGSSLFGSDKVPAVDLGDPNNVAGTLQARYGQLLSQFGGSGAAGFYFGSNTGAQSQNPNFVLDAQAGARRFLVGEAYGSYQPLTDANLSTQMARALLTALQGSQLPEHLRAFFDSLVPESLSGEQINNALQFAATLDQTLESLTNTPIEIAAKRVAQYNEALGTSIDTLDEWKQVFAAAIQAGNVTQENMAVWENLGGALGVVAEAAQQATDRIMQQQQALMEGLRAMSAQQAAQRALAIQTEATALGAAMVSTITAFRQAQQAVNGVLDSIVNGPLSLLSPEARYQSLQGQVMALLTGRRGEPARITPEILQQLAVLGPQFLEASQGYFASGAGYASDYDLITGALRQGGSRDTFQQYRQAQSMRWSGEGGWIGAAPRFSLDTAVLVEIRDELRAANRQRAAVGSATVERLGDVAESLDGTRRDIKRIESAGRPKGPWL